MKVLVQRAAGVEMVVRSRLGGGESTVADARVILLRRDKHERRLID